MTEKKTQIVVENGGLEFVTPEGTVLASLALFETGVHLGVGVPGSKNHVSISVADDFAALSLRRQDSSAVVLSIGKQGGAITVQDIHGNTTACVRTDQHGGRFEARMPSGLPAATLCVGEEGGQVFAFAKEGLSASALTAHAGGGSLSVTTPEAKPSVLIGVDQGDGGLVCYDRNAAPIFAVPTWKFPELRKRQSEGQASALLEGENSNG